MAGDRRATAGYMIASRRIEKVFAADDFSGVSIAGAAGPAIEMVKLFQVQLEHYEKVQGETLSLEGKANQLGQLVRANLPAAMQGFAVVPLFAGFDTARDRGRVFSYDVTGGRYEELDFQAQGSGSIHARNWIKAGWSEGLDADETHRPRDLVAVRGRRRRHRHRRARPRAPHLPDGRGHRHERLPRPHRRRRRVPQPVPPPGRRARRPRVVRAADEHAVLRVAGTGDEGPRRLRAEGHRPRPEPRRAGVPGRRPDRRRQPVAHALARSARSTTASRSRRSASTTSSRCCGSRACATPT